jgi:hypothetical protein
VDLPSLLIPSSTHCPSIDLPGIESFYCSWPDLHIHRCELLEQRRSA